MGKKAAAGFGGAAGKMKETKRAEKAVFRAGRTIRTDPKRF